jgi:plastocyanin
MNRLLISLVVLPLASLAEEHQHGEKKGETLFTPAEIARALQPPPKDFGEVGESVTMTLLHGEMRYSVERMSAKPGTGIRILFANNDEMPHNMVLCKPGKDVPQEVGLAAAALGEDGPKKKYIPKSDKILWHSEVVEPGKVATLYFKAPKEEGDYPYVCTLPGHFATMKGVLFVRKDLSQVPDAPKPPTRGEYFLPFEKEPYVYRSTIPGIGPDAIAVGTPQGIHFAFDPGTCRLALAWHGDFLDVKRDWGGRGGQGTGIPGTTFYKAEKSPLQIEGADPKYRGYRLVEGLPVFLYWLGNAKVEHSILPMVDGGGLTQTIKIEGAKKEATFTNDAKWTSPGRTFEDGKLVFPASKSLTFQTGLRK